MPDKTCSHLKSHILKAVWSKDPCAKKKISIKANIKPVITALLKLVNNAAISYSQCFNYTLLQ